VLISLSQASEPRYTYHKACDSWPVRRQTYAALQHAKLPTTERINAHVPSYTAASNKDAHVPRAELY